jgi:hypothetical protein
MLCGCETLQTLMGDHQVVGIHQPLWQQGTSGWTPEEPAQKQGEPRINRSVAGSVLSVAGLTFEKGIGVGGESHLLYTPHGRAAYIELLAGIDDKSPSETASAEITIYGDGTELRTATLRKRQDARKIKLPISGIYQVQIVIKARDDTYTDIIMPRLIGIPGLRAELEHGRQAHEDMVYAPAVRVDHPQRLANGTVLFGCDLPGYGHCIGISNQLVCLVTAPERDGRIIHFGPDFRRNGLNGSAVFTLHPHERVRKIAADTVQRKWKWRSDPDGTLRLLSPVDMVNGIRWSATFTCISNLPVIRAAVMIKNSVRYDVSWSMGTEIIPGSGTPVIIPRESAAPGYTMLSGRDNGIIADEDFVLVTRKTVSPGAMAIGTTADSWGVVYQDNMVTMIKATEPGHGLYPYNGSRVLVGSSGPDIRMIILSEILPLKREEHAMQEQYWTVMPAGETVKDSIQALLKTTTAASKELQRQTGRPTGRTLLKQRDRR